MVVKILVDPEKCDRCLLCVELCPLGVFYIGENKRIGVDDSKCIGCLACLPLCPRRAIKALVAGKILPEGSKA
jgi:NAD-dependent dihydropyrimidine dehydrogenase PreA subunit